MNLQKACEILEKLSENESVSEKPKLNAEEFFALQKVLLELHSTGMYTIAKSEDSP